MLAALWVMNKCWVFLLGLPMFTLVVDHQPLVTILDKYTLDAVENPRLQRMKEKMSPFIFKTVWRKGKDHAILSQAPVNDPSLPDCVGDTELELHVQRAVIGSV